jgi:hypothetical protein
MEGSGALGHSHSYSSSSSSSGPALHHLHDRSTTAATALPPAAEQEPMAPVSNYSLGHRNHAITSPLRLVSMDRPYGDPDRNFFFTLRSDARAVALPQCFLISLSVCLCGSYPTLPDRSSCTGTACYGYRYGATGNDRISCSGYYPSPVSSMIGRPCYRGGAWQAASRVGKDACHGQRQAPVKKAAAFSSPPASLHIITSGVGVAG